MSYRLSDPIPIFVVCFDGLHTELVENYQFLYYYAIGYLYLALSYKSLHWHNNAGNFCRFVREMSVYACIRQGLFPNLLFHQILQQI